MPTHPLRPHRCRYHLTISKTPGFQESKVKELMLTALPSCKIAHDVGTELSYVLPKESVGAPL